MARIHNWGNFTGRGAPNRAAVHHLSRAITRDPDWVEPVFVRGVLYWRALLDPIAAIADFELFIERAPNSLWAQHARRRMHQLSALIQELSARSDFANNEAASTEKSSYSGWPKRLY
jgi:regulator of sirC expression with transglutaminase-like and TPR domain